MKVYGTYLSAPANKVRLTASALALEHEYINLDLTKGEHKSDEFLAVNPLGKVPAINDNGFCLFESNAICRYMANKIDSPLYPSEAQARALVDQWIDFSSHHILTNMAKILFNVLFAPLFGVEPNPNSIEEGKRFLNAQLPIIETQLQKNNMLCGDKLSLADITMLAAMEPFEMIKYSLKDYPSITAWRNKLMQEDFYTRVHTHYGAELPQIA